ncbi:MAG TPA: hypothetical protein VGB19_09120 [Actinomycetota bacterium]
MSEITVTPTGELTFGVEVAEGEAARTSHVVRVSRDLLDDLQLNEGDAQRLVWESFQFLLEREKPTEILPEFELDEIQRYFPSYRHEIAARVAA